MNDIALGIGMGILGVGICLGFWFLSQSILLAARDIYSALGHVENAVRESVGSTRIPSAPTPNNQDIVEAIMKTGHGLQYALQSTMSVPKEIGRSSKELEDSKNRDNHLFDKNFSDSCEKKLPTYYPESALVGLGEEDKKRFTQNDKKPKKKAQSES